MKEFDTDDYVVENGRELALGTWQYDDLPKTGEKVRIDGVPLAVKGVPRKPRARKSWKGKNIGIWI